MPAESEGSGRTNVVFILTDDQGPWAMSCAGNPEIRTPHLDRLAATGMRFENFFCASPVCSPSRASFFTGQIPSQHGVHDWIREGNVPVGPGAGATEYLAGLTCCTDVLAENGYACGMSGKWHLGASHKPQASFGHWFVHQSGGGDYNSAPMVRMTGPGDYELFTADRYVTNVITDDALAFLDRAASGPSDVAASSGQRRRPDQARHRGENAARPFYLSVHYTAPHSPWTGHPQAIVDSYDDCPFESCPQEPRHPWAQGLTDNCLGNREMLKGYFAAVTAMDADVGRIIDRIEALGLRDRTLVVFASDNGFSCGHHGFWGKGNGTLPLNMYENSVKVPFIMSHPGRIEEGGVASGLVSAYDFTPTLLEYLGIPPLEEDSLPGASFLPVLEGRSDESREDVVIYDEYGPVRMIRTREWKYIERCPEGPDELYNLVDDPGERANLISDPARSGRVKEMKGRLAEWFARYVDPARDGRRQPVSGGGQRRMVEKPSDEGAFFGRD